MSACGLVDSSSSLEPAAYVGFQHMKQGLEFGCGVCPGCCVNLFGEVD